MLSTVEDKEISELIQNSRLWRKKIGIQEKKIQRYIELIETGHISFYTYNSSTRYEGVVHPCPRNPGRYQFSVFDHEGPFCHVSAKTIRALVKAIIDDGFSIVSTNRLQLLC